MMSDDLWRGGGGILKILICDVIIWEEPSFKVFICRELYPAATLCSLFFMLQFLHFVLV